MAVDGILFTHHYAGITGCAPSRTALMQGRHTGHNILIGNYEIGVMGFLAFVFN